MISAPSRPQAATQALMTSRARRLPLKDGLVDWDCAAAIDVGAMVEALTYMRQHGAFPVRRFGPSSLASVFAALKADRADPQPTLESKEDQNSVGTVPISPDTVASLQALVTSRLPPSHPLLASRLALYLVDGFLLYPPSVDPLPSAFDLKLFLRASFAAVKRRRDARDGYVTLEGFWSDPPGYVEKVVWPNYVQEHAWMFEGGDVEGVWKEDVLKQEAIRVCKGAQVDADLGTLLEWMVHEILEELEKVPLDTP